jgi:DNA-binding transcriptional MerR regulator
MGKTIPHVFTPKDVLSFVDITYKQLEYWDKTDLVKPSIGTDLKVRLYSLLDLAFIYLIKTLRDTDKKKYSIQSIRIFLKDFINAFEDQEDKISKSSFVFHPKFSFLVLGEVIISKTDQDKFLVIPLGPFIKTVVGRKR